MMDEGECKKTEAAFVRLIASLSLRDVMVVVAPRHEAGRRRMPRMPIQAAEQPERGPRMAI
jgi:hypothetical protein